MIKADIHCHLLHCVDDGSAGLAESLELLKMEAEDGVKYICITPHLRYRMFETPDDEIIRRFKQLNERRESEGIPVELSLSREYHYDKCLARAIVDGTVITMAGNTVLTEFSYYTQFQDMEKAVLQLKKYGFRPLIAHIERYEVIQKDVSLAAMLAAEGALIQVNAGSILGQEGRITKKTALALLKKDLVYAVASDSHNPYDRAPNLLKCEQFLIRKFGADHAKKVLFNNPCSLIRRQERTEYENS